MPQDSWSSQNVQELMDEGVLHKPQGRLKSSFSWGTVASIDPLRVKIDGDSQPLPYTPVNTSGCGLGIGDRAICMLMGQQYVISGAAGGCPYAPGDYWVTESSKTPLQMGWPGTWVRLSSKFLYASNNGLDVGNESGEATHKLSEGELASHRHVDIYSQSTGEIITTQDGIVQSDVTAYWTRGLRTGVREAGVVTGYTGGNKAHNNMPPHRVVNMWRRTA